MGTEVTQSYTKIVQRGHEWTQVAGFILYKLIVLHKSKEVKFTENTHLCVGLCGADRVGRHLKTGVTVPCS